MVLRSDRMTGKPEVALPTTVFSSNRVDLLSTGVIYGLHRTRMLVLLRMLLVAVHSLVLGLLQFQNPAILKG